MTKNIGYTDRVLRLIGAAILLILFFTGILTGTLGIISVLIAAMLLVTGFVSWCPAYLPFKLTTKRKHNTV